MFDTLLKRCKGDKIKDNFLSQKKVTEKVVSVGFKENLKAFEDSPENVKEALQFSVVLVSWASELVNLQDLHYQFKKNMKLQKREISDTLLSCQSALFQNYFHITALSKKSTKTTLKCVHISKTVSRGTEGWNYTRLFPKASWVFTTHGKFYLRKDRKETLQWFRKTEVTFFICRGWRWLPMWEKMRAHVPFC